MAGNKTISSSFTVNVMEKGDKGDSTATVTIYKRYPSAPTDKPANGAIYTFATGALSGTLRGWSTAFPATNGNPCWCRQAVVTSNTTTATINESDWSGVTEVVEDGKDGLDAAIAYATPDKISVQCLSDGRVSSNTTVAVTFSMKVGNESATSINATAPSSLPTGVTLYKPESNIYSITINTNATASGISAGLTFTISGTHDNKIYAAPITIALIGALKGDSVTGPAGHVGRFYYYAGEYTSGTYAQYLMEETQAPFVKYGSDFWMLDFKGEEPSTIPAAATDNPSASSTCWTQMSSEQQYYIAKAFFGEYAQFGSFIINGDWLLSTKGVLYGTKDSQSTPDYVYFDPLFANGNTKVLLQNVSVKNTSWSSLKYVYLERGKTYNLSLTGNGGNSVYLYVRMNGSNAKTLQISGTTTQTVTDSFTPTWTGLHSIDVRSGNSTANCHVDSYQITAGFTTFSPAFAVDGLTGDSYQNNAVVRGDVQAISVISSNDKMETVIEAGSVTIRSKTTQSYGVFRINSNGEVVLSMFDYEGKKVIDLGGTEEEYVNGEWIPWKLKFLSASRPSSMDMSYYVVNDTDESCHNYYQLQLGQMKNTGTAIQYFLPLYVGATQGAQTSDSGVINRDNMVYYNSPLSIVTNNELINFIKNQTQFIADGYYAKPNNGRFEVDANQYGPTNYKVDIYHFVGGLLDEIVTQRFSL